MSDEHKQYASTVVATLEAHILSAHSAKSEAEWWAQREIERLRAENEKLRAENEKLVAQSWVVDGALLSEREEIEKLRAALDCFMGKETPTQWRYGRNHAEELAKGILAAAALKETGSD